MKIPIELPQFDKRRACIAVFGKSIGICYLAYQGEVKKISQIKEIKPKYSDREGFFARSGKGRVYGTGSVYESKNDALIRRFSRRVADKLEEIAKKKKIDDIYLFEPAYVTNRNSEHFSPFVKRRIRMHVVGNYTKHHSLQLIKEINRKLKVPIIRASKV